MIISFDDDNMWISDFIQLQTLKENKVNLILENTQK